jgi:hypothetical protein
MVDLGVFWRGLPQRTRTGFTVLFVGALVMWANFLLCLYFLALVYVAMLSNEWVVLFVLIPAETFFVFKYVKKKCTFLSC